MTQPSAQAAALEWAVAGAALDGVASGDLHVVCAEEPRWLLAVMDGLGHGPEARRAARECALVLETYSTTPLLELVHCCHDALRGTRGVALTLVSVDPEHDDLEWLAVGNVEGVVLRRGQLPRRPRAAVVQRGGVVGYRLPTLEISHVEVSPGDLIVLATDGIKSGFFESLDPHGSVQELADFIAERFARTSDDKLVLVARYSGKAGA